MVAEFLHIKINEPPSVLTLLLRHIQKHFGAVWIIIAQSLREIGIDSIVFLLVADREGEKFTFGKIIKVAHGAGI